MSTFSKQRPWSKQLTNHWIFYGLLNELIKNNNNENNYKRCLENFILAISQYENIIGADPSFWKKMCILLSFCKDAFVNHNYFECWIDPNDIPNRLMQKYCCGGFDNMNHLVFNEHAYPLDPVYRISLSDVKIINRLAVDENDEIIGEDMYRKEYYGALFEYIDLHYRNQRKEEEYQRERDERQAARSVERHNWY